MIEFVEFVEFIEFVELIELIEFVEFVELIEFVEFVELIELIEFIEFGMFRVSSFAERYSGCPAVLCRRSSVLWLLSSVLYHQSSFDGNRRYLSQ